MRMLSIVSLGENGAWPVQRLPQRIFLVMVHEENPAATIVQLKQIITDKRKFILFPDAVAVLDAHIKAGYGNSVPDWR